MNVQDEHNTKTDIASTHLNYQSHGLISTKNEGRICANWYVHIPSVITNLWEKVICTNHTRIW